MMNRNLFIRELRSNLLSLILWMIVIILLITVTMTMYPIFLENRSQVLGMMSLIPKGALQIKGFSDINSLFSVLGFYAANNVVYMLLLGSIFGVVIGSNIILKEEYNKTAEYLLTRPVTRSEVFFSKVGIVFLYVFLLNFVAAIAGFISIEYFRNSPFSIRAFMTLSLYTFLLNLFFSCTGVFLSTLVKRARPVTVFSIGLVLIFYFINSLSTITEGASKIGYLSPFKYADMNAIKPGYGPDPLNLLFFVGLSALMMVLAFRIYIRKDIYT